jgi:hypothetical protein
VARTISDLWLVIHNGRLLDIRAPIFSSRQIEGEVARANVEHRSGRTDWVAVDLAEGIIVFSEIHAAANLKLYLRDLGRTRH